jgi:hypothetical protein
MIPPDQLVDPTVRTFVTALNENDRSSLRAVLTPDAAMSDDGSDRDLEQWLDREVFSSNGHMAIESQSDDGRSLVARYRNDTWGEMRTRWTFTVTDDRISRFDTGQA